METIEIGRLCLETVPPLRQSQTHLFRGYVSHRFPAYDIIHNHDLETGRHKYRYPAVQFKVVYDKALIVAVGPEAVEIVQKIFCEIGRTLEMRDQGFSITRRTMEVAQEQIGIVPELLEYQFLSPWIGLNQDNYEKYTDSSRLER